MFKPGITVHACHPSTLETEAAGPGVQGQPGTYGNSLYQMNSQNSNNNKGV